MERCTGEQIADWAGVSPEYLAQLVDLGIIEPGEDGLFDEADFRAVRIVQSLDQAGLPLAGLGQAIRNGALALDFTRNPSYARWASLSETTFRSLSEQTGVPVELLSVVREAAGSAPPQPGDRIREDELAIVPLVQYQCEQGFRLEVVERALRVAGDSMRRIAETESDWWRTEVMMPIMSRGNDLGEMIRVTNEVSPTFSELGDRAMMAIYHGQQTSSWLRNILEGFEAVLMASGLEVRPETVPAICFLDLTGYTRLTEERGDDAAVQLTKNLATLVQRNSARYGGRAIKWLGDGVMFHFPVPAQGVQAALDMVVAADEAGLPPAHVGLHAGPVLFQEGDYFGRTVNVTSQVADYARPGEVLVTQDVVEVTDSPTVEFVEIGPVELKGVSAPLHLYRALSAAN